MPIASLVSFLMGMAGPLAIRVITSLGFSALTYAGVDTLMNSLVTFAQSNWSSLPVQVLQLASLSGIPDMLGMIFGAYITTFTMRLAAGATRYILKP